MIHPSLARSMMKPLGGCLALLCCAMSGAVISAGEAAQPTRFSGWRGDGSGRYAEATPALTWSATQNVRWSATVGHSYSSPVVTDRCVLVTAEPDILVCLERSSGKERWKIRMTPADLSDAQERKKAEAYQLPEHGSGMTAATALTDGHTIYTVCANGIVRAINMDGKLTWASYIEAEQNTAYGRASSPIMVDGKLIVNMTNLYAFDPATGKRLWVNTDATSTYGTPVAFTSNGIELIATSGGDVVRVADGKNLASRVGVSFNASPVTKDGIVYYSDHAVKAVRMTAALKDEELWSCDIDGDIFGSPVVHDGIMFVITGQGELYAFETVGKGEQKPLIKARPLLDGGGSGAEPIVYASLTLAGRHLFLTSNQGDIVVFEATREAKQVAKNKMPAGTGAAPFFSGKDMFLRDGDQLFCIGE